MKKAIFSLMFIVSSAHAGLEKDAYEMFSMREKMMTNRTTVTVRSVDNVKDSCEAESRKRGFGGLGFPMAACSFWDEKGCTIIVGPKANNDILGHELRHCFQGNFH